MDRADRKGLGIAVAGHLLLFAALTIGIARRPPPVHVQAETMDVQLVDKVGLQSAAPTPATEAPQEQVAPEQGPPEEAAPAPEPTPAPPTLAPRAEPTPAPPKPKPSPAPAPSPEPAPRPVKAKPAPAPTPTKPVAAKPAARLNGSDLLKDLRSAARSEAKSSGAGEGKRSAGSRLGPDFLKGVANPSPGKGATPRAALTGAAMNGLAAAIRRQVQPCYELGALGGTPAMGIVTVLRLRFNKDGSVAGTPQVVEQTGIDASNRGYSQQMADLSRRAVLRCAPLKLPAELYAGGWEEIDMGFIPRQMQ